jgi:hypothetical protein
VPLLRACRPRVTLSPGAMPRALMGGTHATQPPGQTQAERWGNHSKSSHLYNVSQPVNVNGIHQVQSRGMCESCMNAGVNLDGLLSLLHLHLQGIMLSLAAQAQSNAVWTGFYVPADVSALQPPRHHLACFWHTKSAVCCTFASLTGSKCISIPELAGQQPSSTGKQSALTYPSFL